MKLRSTYYVSRVTEGKVFIVDEDVGMSVTNDAENVVLEVLTRYPNHRIIYRDTTGRWDELVHDNEKFTGFAPYRMT